MTSKSRFWALAVLPLAMAVGACEAEEEPVVEDATVVAEPVPVTPAVAVPAPAPAAAGMATISMQPLNNSGAMGEAMLTPMGQQTQVMVNLTSTPQGTHAGHIHQGTCASPGSVVVPLQPIEVGADGAGTMTTTVDVPAETAMNGQHIIVYHEAGGDPGQPIVCGAIPAAPM